MKEKLNAALDALYDELFTTSLERAVNSPQTAFNYTLDAGELRKRLGRVRLHRPVIEHVLAYFRRCKVMIVWLDNVEFFNLRLDLMTAAQNVTQAKLFTERWHERAVRKNPGLRIGS